MLQALIGVLPAVASMFGGQNNDMDAQLQNQWQSEQLRASTQMATDANQAVQQATARAQDAYMQSGGSRQQALSSIVDGFRNALLRGGR